jgi:hypothetical protein
MDSDVIPTILNARPLPANMFDVSPALADERNTVAWESLLSPQAQAGPTAVARGIRSAPDADALLNILNAGFEDSDGGIAQEDFWMSRLLAARAREGLARGREVLLGILHQDTGLENSDNAAAIKDSSSWIDELLSAQARQRLAALAENGETVTDSDALLDILNGGDENLYAAADVDSTNDSWMAGLLSADAREGLSALEHNDGMVDDSDAILDILNARNSSVKENTTSDWEAELLNAGFAALAARSVNQVVQPNGAPEASWEPEPIEDAPEWESELCGFGSPDLATQFIGQNEGYLSATAAQLQFDVQPEPRIHQFLEGCSTDRYEARSRASSVMSETPTLVNLEDDDEQYAELEFLDEDTDRWEWEGFFRRYNPENSDDDEGSIIVGISCG